MPSATSGLWWKHCDFSDQVSRGSCDYIQNLFLQIISDVCLQFAVSTKISGSEHVCLDSHNCFGKHILSLDRPLLANISNSYLSLFYFNISCDF